jgi:hypothetical protein
MPHKKIVHSSLAVFSASAMSAAWHHQQVKIFAGSDQGVGQSQGRFWRHIVIQLAHNQKQPTTQAVRMINIG